MAAECTSPCHFLRALSNLGCAESLREQHGPIGRMRPWSVVGGCGIHLAAAVAVTNKCRPSVTQLWVASFCRQLDVASNTHHYPVSGNLLLLRECHRAAHNGVALGGGAHLEPEVRVGGAVARFFFLALWLGALESRGVSASLSLTSALACAAPRGYRAACWICTAHETAP
jgi:hypothetical protein